MSARTRDRLPTLIPLLIASFLFFWGIDWGLPSRDVDSRLFGDRTPWTGSEILALLDSNQPTSTTRGADVDATPILDRSKPIILNDTDANRAEIVQRYRLMSGQPDEFIQFKALAEMAGRSGIDRFDPRLYQYGGLWIYPVGALLKIGSIVGLVELNSDRAFYLDHPEAFGRFYVVARAYSALWGLVGVWAMFQIVKITTANNWLASCAALLFALMPVVMSSAQEAKPHLAGAVLTLLAVLAAARHVETGKVKWSLLACALCACAASMVLSAILSCAILPVMVWLGRKNRTIQKPIWKDVLRLIEMFALVGILFTLFNPFLVYNGLFRPELLKSNLGNSAAMYGISIRGIWRAIEILGAAMTWPVLIVAILGSIVLILRRVGFSPRLDHQRPDGGLKPTLQILQIIFTAALPTLVIFVALASNKPMEFARFGIVVASLALIVIALALSQLRNVLAIPTALLLIFWAGYQQISQTRFALADSQQWKTLESETLGSPSAKYGIWHEPAPWSCPPLNLFDRPFILLPPKQPIAYDQFIYIEPTNLESNIDDVDRQRISWKLNSWNISIHAIDP